MIKNLRPREAAAAMGFGMTKFWSLAKSDPDFPVLIRLGTRTTVLEEQDLRIYMQKLRDRQAVKKEAVPA